MKGLFQAPSIDWPYKYRAKQKLAQSPLLQRFYQAELADGNSALGEIEFVAMDFETTGLDANKDEIITIGLVPFTLQRVYLNRAQHWIVRPRQKLDEGSVIIHGITHSDIMHAPDLSEVFAALLTALEGKIVVAHYHKIEREFLDQAFKRRINEGIEFPIIDTMQLEAEIQKRLTAGIWNKLRGKQPQSLRLGQARQRYGLPAYNPHHALTDAIATAELMQAQIAHHYSADDGVKRFWL